MGARLGPAPASPDPGLGASASGLGASAFCLGASAFCLRPRPSAFGLALGPSASGCTAPSRRCAVAPLRPSSRRCAMTPDSSKRLRPSYARREPRALTGRLGPHVDFFRRVGCAPEFKGSPRAEKSIVRPSAVARGARCDPHESDGRLDRDREAEARGREAGAGRDREAETARPETASRGREAARPETARPEAARPGRRDQRRKRSDVAAIRGISGEAESKAEEAEAAESA